MMGLIENKIIERLCQSEMLKGFDIESFPANFEEYNFTSSLGCILVCFNGEDFSEPETLSATVQTDTYLYTVYLGLRSLSVLSEANPTMHEIKSLLTGYRVNGKPLYPVNIKYVGKINSSDNFWSLTFKTKQSNASQYDHNVIPAIWTNKPYSCKEFMQTKY